MSTTQPPKPKRRWCRFSLKTLLIVMTVATLTFGVWVQVRRQRAQENRDRAAKLDQAIAWVEELGGLHYIKYERSPKTWLQEQFNDPGDYWPIVIHLQDSTVSDADLEYLGGLTEIAITDLDLSNTAVTNVAWSTWSVSRNLMA